MDLNDDKARVAAKRHCFTLPDDIVMLNEVLNIRPFMELSRWAEVAENVSKTTGKAFIMRGAGEHLNLILAYFITNDKANLRN